MSGYTDEEWAALAEECAELEVDAEMVFASLEEENEYLSFLCDYYFDCLGPADSEIHEMALQEWNRTRA